VYGSTPLGSGFHLLEQSMRIAFQKPAQLQELDDVQPPLAMFDFGHERLWTVQFVGHCLLGQT